MAVDVESIIMDALLGLVEDVPLARVTIKQILERSGVSRQTFYNHFRDKNDLVCRIYDKRIIGEFDLDMPGPTLAYLPALTASLERMRAFGGFLRQAFAVHDQNNLTEHALAHTRDFDLAWHQRVWGPTPMPQELRAATEYHALAAAYMTIAWVLTGFSTPEPELARLLADMRASGMGSLFAQAPSGRNPYVTP